MREPRSTVMTMVEASWQDPSGIVQTWPARMEVKSAGGACIRIKTPVEIGSRLNIQWRFEQFSGIARNCRSDGHDYLVGIQRDAVTVPLPKRPLSSDVAQPIPKKLTEEKSFRAPATSNSPATLITKAIPPMALTTPSPSTNVPTERTPRRIGHELNIARQKNTPAQHEPAQDMNSISEKKSASPVSDTCPGNDAPSINAQPAAPQIKEPVKRKPTLLRERKRMRSKWFGMASREGDHAGPVKGYDERHNDSRHNGNYAGHMQSPAENRLHIALPNHAPDVAPLLSVELLPMEDIYRAAGIMNPQRGYGILKVVDMLRSEHITSLPREMKRAAVLMALDAANIPFDQVQQDAKARQDALNSYEFVQKEQLEAEWSRRIEQNNQIQAELESVKASYMARINRNLEGIAREKATFNEWLGMKQQEAQSMTDASELCQKTALAPVASTAEASAPPRAPELAKAMSPVPDHANAESMMTEPSKPATAKVASVKSEVAKSEIKSDSIKVDVSPIPASDTANLLPHEVSLAKDASAKPL